jgi:septal ring-binding cell division protein DamX
LVYEEARKYMEHYLAINGLPEDTLSAARMIRVYKESQGNIGAIKRLVSGSGEPAPTVASPPSPPPPAPHRPSGPGLRRAIKYISGAALLAVLVLAVVFQEQINQLFQPQPAELATAGGQAVSGSDAMAPLAVEKPAADGEGIASGRPAPSSASEPVADTDQVGESAPAGSSESAVGASPAPELKAEPAVSPVDTADDEELIAQFSQEEIGAIDEIDTLLDLDTEDLDEPGATAPPAASPDDSGSSPGVIDIRVEEEAEVGQAPTSDEAAVTPPPAIAQPAEGLQGADWILRQNPDYYTLQLMALRDKAALLDIFRNVKNDMPLAYFDTLRKDEVFHAVVYGAFASRAAAEAAPLPAGVGRITPWIRKFRGVQRDIEKTRASIGQ